MKEAAIGNKGQFRALKSEPPQPGTDSSFSTRPINTFSEPDALEIAKFLRLVLQVVQKAAGTDAFFHSALAATNEIAELDRSAILIRKSARAESTSEDWLDDEWLIAAEVGERVDVGSVSERMLEHVLTSGATVIYDPSANERDPSSVLAEKTDTVRCAVAAPVLREDREVIGVLYGYRGRSGARSTNAIDDMDATLIEILAGSVAGGIARRREERLRSTLSEFFSPRVADLLASRPDLMEGQDAIISVLFCDVRGFSAVTEKLTPKRAIVWINDVMTELSQCVIDRDGVLVDYVGDAIFAMWGAPTAQEDHARRAIETAKDMMNAIERLRARWSSVIPSSFGAGIGVNTGPARVGNVGSEQKFKYGPIGNTVNICARLQATTKYFRNSCVVGGKSILASNYVEYARRLAKASVPGIDAPIDIFEIDDRVENWHVLRDRYQVALEDFENGRFEEAAKIIGSLLPLFPNDRACRRLLTLAVTEMDEPSGDFAGVWNLT